MSPRRLAEANDYAEALGGPGFMTFKQARALDEVTLTRRRRVLGVDHPDTLASVNNLAADLRALGGPEAK